MRSRQQRKGAVAGHPKCVGEFVVVKLVVQAQLDDIPLARIQPVDRGPEQLLDVGLCSRDADLGDPGPQTAEALVTGDRVEPGAQLGPIAQVPELGGGDEERVLQRVGGIGRLAQHRTAVGVERHGVPVIRFGKPGRVTGHDGGDNLRVLHAAIP